MFPNYTNSKQPSYLTACLCTIVDGTDVPWQSFANLLKFKRIEHWWHMLYTSRPNVYFIGDLVVRFNKVDASFLGFKRVFPHICIQPFLRDIWTRCRVHPLERCPWIHGFLEPHRTFLYWFFGELSQLPEWFLRSLHNIPHVLFWGLPYVVHHQEVDHEAEAEARDEPD